MIRSGSAVLLVVAVLALAGCGGDSGSSASEDYANDVCSNLSTWIRDVQEQVQSLTDAGLATSREDVQNAFDQTKEATDSMVNDLQQLGAPETEDGQKAKSELDQLGNEVQQQLDTVEQELQSGSGLLEIATTVTTALSEVTNKFQSTYQNLQNLDPPGELRDAFQNADECNSLEEQVQNLRQG